MLRRDIFVLQALRLVRGSLDGPTNTWVRREGAALDPGPLLERSRQLAAELRQVDPETAQGLGRDAVVGLHESGEEMLGIEHWALQLLGEALGGDYRFLGLLGEAVEVHGFLAVGRPGPVANARWPTGSRSSRGGGGGTLSVA